MMFKIIDTKNRKYHQQDLGTMFATRSQRALAQDDPTYDHDKSVYLFFEDSVTGLVGSARLNPMTHKNLVSDLFKDHVKPCTKSSIWECSALSLHTGPKNSKDQAVFDHTCKLYYRAFYEALVTACVRFGVGLVLFLNFKDEIENLTSFGEIPLRALAVKDALTLALFQNPHRH